MPLWINVHCSSTTGIFFLYYIYEYSFCSMSWVLYLRYASHHHAGSFCQSFKSTTFSLTTLVSVILLLKLLWLSQTFFPISGSWFLLFLKYLMKSAIAFGVSLFFCFSFHFISIILFPQYWASFIELTVCFSFSISWKTHGRFLQFLMLCFLLDCVLWLLFPYNIVLHFCCCELALCTLFPFILHMLMMFMVVPIFPSLLFALGHVDKSSLIFFSIWSNIHFSSSLSYNL